mmetsp:Transcript_46/g.111  ORF Transcript_46/g.111 Transcript_46/m.111 type:complete len:491 (-) Transcript_46:413-1885(-)
MSRERSYRPACHPVPTMRSTTLRPPTIVIAVCLLRAAAVVGAAEIGKPHSSVITLGEKNFDDHLNDPANGLWLLKFYAPWCGHCKSLAPVLDAVAPFLAGKMSIGKVDCTVEKKLCKRHDVKGYPTLKYYRDGDFQDYPLGRDKDSIITFGEKMSNRAVKIVATHRQATEELLAKTPVAFIVYDPDGAESSSSTIDASGATDDEKAAEKLVQSTERTRAFGQAARRMQAQGSFGLLSPKSMSEEVAKFFVGGGVGVPSRGFIARIEEDVPTKLYQGEISTSAIEEWVKEKNLAAVLELGGHNFRFVSRRGKHLAIGAYDPDEEAKTKKLRRDLKEYAVRGKHREEYIFATMDGKRWDKFLNQFSIKKENLPEMFIIDVPERTYWQDPSVFGIAEFIEAVINGEIESREQEKRKNGPLDDFLQAFVDYMPWSLMAMFALFIVIFWLALPKLSSDIILPPPPPEARAPKGKQGQMGRIVSEDDSDGSNKKDR